MKFVTEIPPRKDGTVILQLGGQDLTFMPNGEGLLITEVPDHLVPAVLELDGFIALNIEVPWPPVVPIPAPTSATEFEDTHIAEIEQIPVSKSITPKARGVAKSKS